MKSVRQSLIDDAVGRGINFLLDQPLDGRDPFRVIVLYGNAAARDVTVEELKEAIETHERGAQFKRRFSSNGPIRLVTPL